MARKDEGYPYSWSTVAVALFAVVAIAWCCSFARLHAKVYRNRKNWEVWHIPELLNDMVQFELQSRSPADRPYPELPKWKGAAPPAAVPPAPSR